MKILKKLFYGLLIIFILIFLVIFLIPLLFSITGLGREILNIIFLFLAILFFLSGIALIFLIIKLKIKRKLRIFLILTGISPLLFLFSAVSHNLLYALNMNLLSTIFLFISILICPIIFLIGAIGSMLLFKHKGKSK